MGSEAMTLNEYQQSILSLYSGPRKDIDYTIAFAILSENLSHYIASTLLKGDLKGEKEDVKKLVKDLLGMAALAAYGIGCSLESLVKAHLEEITARMIAKNDKSSEVN